MTLCRAYGKRLVLANWKGIIFHCFDLDRHVTGLEGRNGAGKTTVMAAYVTAILPNLKLLSFKNVNGTVAARGDGGLWGRIGEDGVCYALIEWITPRGKSMWAGVAMTRGSMPTIDIKPITIHDLPAKASPYDVLLLRESSGAVVPQLPQLREHVAMHGARLVTHKTLADYMRVLFDQGVTPMPMTTHEEQERFYRVLSTSMEGSALATLIKTGLRDYLLSPDTSLERRISLMRESLQQCRLTKRELERAQVAHREISELFDAAWKMASFAYFGARGRYEQESRNWKEKSAASRKAHKSYGELNTTVTVLQHRVEFLKHELVTAQEAVVMRQSDLQQAERARALRTQLTHSQQALSQRQKESLEAQARSEATATAEQDAEQALQHAQDEHTRTAEELANVQKAVEGLVRRVTQLRIARTYLADARKALHPVTIDQDNAAAIKQCLDRDYAAQTRRYTELQVELDTLGSRMERFEVMFGHLQKLILSEHGQQPDPADAHSQALAFETRLRARRTLAARLENVQEQLRGARELSGQQAQARQMAEPLGVHSSAELGRELDGATARLEELERDMAGLAQQIVERQAALVDAKGRLASLEEAARRYGEALSWHVQLVQTCPDWAAQETMDGLAQAADLGRHQAADIEQSRRHVESALRETEERIRSLESAIGPLDPQLGAVAEHVGGHLFASRFDELPVQDAASVQARLGAWAEAIIVAVPDHAARHAAELADRPDTLLFVSQGAALALEGSRTGSSLEDSELVVERFHGEPAARLTRWPRYPMLGRRARALEIGRLQAQRDLLRSELAALRETARLMKERLRLADKILSFGNIMWMPDPRPALLADQAAIRTLGLALTDLHGRSAAVRNVAQEIGRRRERLMALEARRSLLDPPDHAHAAKLLQAELEAARAAQAWLDRHGATARELMDGLPILANPVDPALRGRLREQLAKLQRQREHVMRQREALDRLLAVITHLAHEQDERLYEEQTSIIHVLQGKIAPSRAHVETEAARLKIRRAEFASARDAAARASAAQHQAAERCSALATELALTGLRGGEEEVVSARRAHQTATGEAGRLGGEWERTNTSFIEQRTRLTSLDQQANAYRQEAFQQLTVLRFERRAQRELDRVVHLSGLRGKIDSDLNRQQHFPTGSQINAFQSSQNHQALLLERLKPFPEVLMDLTTIEGFHEPSGERRAIQTLRAWERVLRHIEQRIPRNLASADDPQVALAQMSEKMSELQRTLASQEDDMRTRSSGLADGISARQRSARSLVIRLNKELEKVQFGSISGLQIAISHPDDMAKMLACLRQENSLALFDTGSPLEETLARLYQRETGGMIKGERLFDYRHYLQLRLEMRRLNGKWEATGDVSTGEAIGIGAAVLVMILRTWNEEANRISGSGGYAMQQILLDEANRLDEQALDTLTDFCQRMDVQALVAAPGLEKPRRSTVFQMSRTLRGSDEYVTIRGTRITE